jgi:hypothetical protein
MEGLVMRRSVTTGQPMYRVVVERFEKIKNRDYVQGSGSLYWILTDRVLQSEYGPYATLGTAKGVLTRETVDTWDEGKLKWGVQGGWIELAEIAWKKVDLDG